MSVRIICDSTADLNPAIAESIQVIPLTIRFGEQEYIDGVTITKRQFYEKLVECDVLPTTSQITPGVFTQEFQKVVDAGDTAVVMTLAAEMSGTYQSAVIAAEDFPGKIFVVDSRSVTIGFGILAEYALSLARQGMGAQEIAEALTEQRKRVRVVALLDTLEYLKRGGRISKAVAFTGTMLSIKPVVGVEDGMISVLGKARGSKQGNNLLVKQLEAAGGFDPQMPLLLGYSGLSDAMAVKYREDTRPLWGEKYSELRTAYMGSVIGTHAGPGIVAVAFFCNQPEK